MKNWKRILAAAGTAAMLVSNLGSVTQAVFATENYTEDVMAQDSASDASVNHDQQFNNASSNEGESQNDLEALLSVYAEDNSAFAQPVADTPEVIDAASGDGFQGDDANDNTDDGTGENIGDDTASDDQTTDSGDGTADDTFTDIDGADANTPTEGEITDGTELPTEGTTEDAEPDTDDDTDSVNEYALSDSIAITLDTKESSRLDPAIDENGTYLYNLGETAATIISISNPSDYLVSEDDGAVVRLYMQFTDAVADEIDAIPYKDDSQVNEVVAAANLEAELLGDTVLAATAQISEADADVYVISADASTEMDLYNGSNGKTLKSGEYTAATENGTAYCYTVYELGDGIYCYEFDRPLNGETYSVELTSTYAMDSLGGTNDLWGVVLSADDRAELDTDGIGVADRPDADGIQETYKWGSNAAFVTADTTKTAETENYTVSVTYGADSMIPAEAELKVTEYGTETEVYQRITEQTEEQYDWLLDISFIYNDLQIEPQAPITITVTPKTADAVTIDEQSVTTITHFADDGTEIIENDNIEITQDADENAQISFELSSLSLVAGTTYHTATVVKESSFSWNNDYLIYKVSGNYVYFVANSAGSAVTFRVALSDVGKKEGTGATESNMTALNSTSYYKDSLSGTIIDAYGNSYNATLNWSNLVWHHNGADRGSDGSLQNTTTTDNQYLKISNGSISMSWWQDVYAAQGSSSQYTVFSERQTYYVLLLPVTNTYYLVFDGAKFTGSSSSSGGNLTLAKVGDDHKEEDSGSSTGTGKTAVYTGTITDMPLGFYSVHLGENNKVEGLAGVSYTIYKEDGSIAGVVTTTSDKRVDISSLGLQNGNYTMKMTGVPSGYLCEDSTWSFTITSNSKTLSLKNEGTGKLEGIIVVNPTGNLTYDKTGSVADYENRVYQIDLTAKSNMIKAQIEDLSIDFIVDQSNSMLFPSGLKEVGNYFSVKKTSYKYTGDDDKQHTGYTYTGTVDWQDHLDTKKLYYVITQEDTSSTVWALWYDKVWKVQDASYYAKAYYGTNRPDKIITSNVVSYPTSKTYDGSAGCAGAALYSDNNLDGSGFKSDLNKADDGATKTYMVYEAVDEYNRLHYLEQSMSDLLQMLAAMCPEAEVTLDCFVNTIKSCNTYVLGQDYDGTSGLQKLLDLVGAINTDGGTRQDVALEHAYETHQQNNSETDKYLVLITDGAPATSTGSDITLGSATDDIPSAIVSGTSGTTVYQNINYWAKKIKDSGTTLATVGLAMQNVKEGSKSMRFISTDGPSTTATVSGDHGDWWFQPKNSSDLMNILCDQIFNKIVSAKQVDPDYGTVVDYISDSFYPVDPKTQNQVASGTRIDAEGNVVGSGEGIGTILKAEDGSWYVQWDRVRITGSDTTTDTKTTWYKGDTSRRYSSWGRPQDSYYENGRTYTWQTHDGVTAYWASETSTSSTTTDYSFKGRVYLKAKEDFIGGNAINTNKKATLTLESGGTYEYNKPTVNVHLLDMNSMETEVTVYKGDTINEKGNTPLDSVKYFYTNVEIEKLVSGTGGVLNKVGATEEQGCKAGTFTLAYATGVSQLTTEQWQTLMKGDKVSLPYTYNSADGEVGYFVFELTKDGNTADYDSHEATEAGGTETPVETYTLKVTYQAYKLGENDRPQKNEHNGTPGPGTEVGGTAAGDTLAAGKGTVESTNVHKVYVIDGTIRIWKEITEDLKSDQDQTYTFALYKVITDEDGNTSTSQVGDKQTVTVKAGATTSEGKAEWMNLERGTYVVAEDDPQNAVLKNITVKDETTNCWSLGNGSTKVTFTLGDDTEGINVIGKAENALYTSYTGTPNGVLGEAVITNTKRQDETTRVVVNKVWDDGNEQHSGDTITVRLYRDNVDTGQYAELSAETGWSAEFSKLPIYSDPEHKTGRYKYTVKEDELTGYSVTYTTEYLEANDPVWIPATGFEDGETYIIVTSDGVGDIVGMEADSKGKGFAWTTKNGAGTIMVSSSDTYDRYITDEEAQGHTAMQWTAGSVGLIKGDQVGYRYAFTLRNVKTGKYAKDNGQGDLTEKAGDKATYFYYGYTVKDANGDEAKRKPSNSKDDWSAIIGSMNDYFPLEDNHTGDGNSTKAQRFYLYKRVDAAQSVTTVTVTNHKQYELPKTGGAGTLPYELGGSAALLGSMFVSYSRRRRHRKEGE